MGGFALFDTPAGPCGLAWNDALEVCGGQLPEATPALSRQRLQRRFPGLAESAPPPAIAAVIERLVAALQGAPDTLEDVPLADAGVPEFNRRVYALARRIPPGQTCSYGELAAELGGPAVARAVGQALGRNHFAPLVPCHRVLGAQHQAGGFSGPGGLKTKLQLLQLEGAKFGDQPGLF